MWAPLPAASGHGFGASDATRPLRRGDPADRLADEDLLVGGPERRAMGGRDLLLAVAELGVVLLERDLLRLERRGERVDVVLRRRHADGREAEARVDRRERPALVVADRQRELVLEGRLEPRAARRQRGGHALQEPALVDGRDAAVQGLLVGEHRPRARGVGEHAERAGVGHEADLAHRPHPLDALEVVEAVHRLHGDRDADARADPALEPVPRRGLRPHRPVVAAPEEADEAQARRVGALDHRGGAGVPGHRSSALVVATAVLYRPARRRGSRRRTGTVRGTPAP